MSLKEWVRKLVGEDKSGCSWSSDCEGINFIFSAKQVKAIHNAQANDLLIHQHITLRMLVEQGEAEELPNGVLLQSSVAVCLDENSRALLKLPEPWGGNFHADIKGKTGSSSFQVELSVSNDVGKFTYGYSVEGPIIGFSPENRYLLTPAQLVIFNAQNRHSLSDKTEFDNLSLVLALQKAQKMGVDISLGHFEKLKILAPESITIEAELDGMGRLILTPQMGQAASHERIQRVLGQLSHDEAISLRVDKEIVLFDEKRLMAIQEVLRNRLIPKEKVAAFIKNPTAFIDASLVDLDLGFSARVKGVTQFRHAYFGETDESGIDWFGKKFSAAEIFPAKKLEELILDQERLEKFREEFGAAEKTAAQELEFEGALIDISDTEQIKSVLNKIEQNLSQENPAEPLEGESEREQGEEKEGGDANSISAVVDIELNDENLECSSDVLDRKIKDVLIEESQLDWSGYRRTPFPHQIVGVRWILGLALETQGHGGALLADDMGLGKTFMALAAIEHLYKACRLAGEAEKPCLVVAPLSVLQNWADEVEDTFEVSPFKDIVILQSDGQLSDFKVGGVETKNQELLEEGEATVRYSLKVGAGFNNERLDIPRRLVITTYQTMRDYQFSLCSVDWGMVVFDEAQNVKNPNALQTRAAKGIKADFRLVATGTPVENTLADFWCLMDTACPGYLDSYQAFRTAYITPILRAAGDEIEAIRGDIGRKLRERVGALMLRRVKEDNLEGLPNKVMFVGMEGSDWRYSDQLSSTLKAGQLEAYDLILSDEKSSEENRALAALQRLRDVSLHPRLVFGGRLDSVDNQGDLSVLMKESGKFCSVLSVLDGVKKQKEKCIIFVINKQLQSFLSSALAKTYHLPLLSIINGDAKAVAKRVGTPTRKSMIKAFEAREGFNIIIMSPIAAGVGLTVVGANNVIHLERHWNPAKEAQATDRVYRIGQKRRVNVFIPLIHHPEYQSFDVNLHQLLAKKSLLKDAVVTPEQVVPSPTGFAQKEWSPSQRISSDELVKLSWQQFEALCAELFAKVYQADSCWLTADGADYGADVVLVKKDEVILIQCKHTVRGHHNGHKAVTEVCAAKIKYAAELSKPVTSLIFATNAGRLSEKTRKAAKLYWVEVVGKSELSKLLESHEIQYIDLLRRLDKERFTVK
ncbi:MAG: SNF2-related protein [Gammaproteobacteria bacterium]|nr:SNF2-related protein [Gammaproteobacteria bacterium]